MCIRDSWWAVFVPTGTPRPVVDKLASLFNDIQKLPETNKFLNTYGSDAWIFTPEEGQARLAKDVKDWADYVKVGKIDRRADRVLCDTASGQCLVKEKHHARHR